MQDPSLTSKPHLSVAASSDLTRHCSECRVKKGESFKVLGTSVQFSSVQLLSCVQLFATPWTAASLSIINSRSLLKLMSIESMMSSNHLILCHPLLLLPSIFPSITVFSDKSVLCIRLAKVLELQLEHQSFQ